MRIIHIGDVVGKPGRKITAKAVQPLRQIYRVDVILVNAENAAGGSGLTPDIYQELISAGVDGITLGDHIYRRREIISILESESNIVKPANFPRDAPGLEWAMLPTLEGPKVVVISLLGRVFMRPVNCPWEAAERVLDQLPSTVRIIVVDFHAEATSDMQLMGRFLDGRVSAVLGTHTHVATADEQILPKGTAFQCDLGMTGPHDSILGRRFDRVLETTRTFRPTFFEVASDDVRLSGTIIDVDNDTGLATSIERIQLTMDRVQELAKQCKQDEITSETR